MGIAKKTDGRYEVGLGVSDANDYKGSASYRDIYIQLTADGATADSVEKLTFLKDYAVYHSGLGEPIMPPSVNVWISNNGVTTAVEADDLSLDGDNYTICGIVWNGSSWDYSNAGQGHGGGGGGLPSYTSADIGKVLTVVEDGSSATAAWENGVAIITIDSVTDANNEADWAIYVNGEELTSEDAVADYLDSIGDRPMVVKFSDFWSGATYDRATVLYRDYSFVVFLETLEVNLASYKTAGYLTKIIGD